ncbi:glucosamine--fructose-6-phosphate aminotransferase, isomerizing [Mycobacterium sp. JS623]|uniref:glutamine--fructose-6-phosphate transaminase (isomerizing) n=1 Tax=Mycobacterium sp. JS623 TaxID=212767 RepID=UPI0002A56F54|nr:glutamine--fructose-6-phosphate transaminase (isomerizing) [Mycobacterium sp. JS623]AGB25971.1 glucosamine--fructose-6-phosphate aminotransferase, isomerizing [Mycobacterium sp. JS623]
MCGIVACRTHEPAVDYLRVALRRLEYRGYDSVGIALQTTTGDLARFRTVGRVAALDSLVRDWAGPQFDGVGIGHTRWATHGGVTVTNAHPHADCTGQISLVHNGVIDNADALRNALAASGHRFTSSVDSEVLCHLIEDARTRCGDLFEALQLALTRVEGSWALAALEAGTGQITVAAHGSPLLVARTPDGDFAASDFAAIADWADQYRVLDDGDVVDLTSSDRWSHRGIAALPPAVTRSTWQGRDADLNGYTDYMAKEIDEQPEVAGRLLDELERGIATGALWNELELAPFERLRVIGCGTSLNAGHVIGNLVRRLGRVPATTIVGSEAAEEIADAHQLCLVISQSGETADVLHAVKSEAVAGSPLLALTNSSHSTLARQADAMITCGAGPEIGVAATKTFICQIITGAALMISALVAMDRLSARLAARLVDDLRRLPDQLAAAGAVAKCLVPPLTEEVEGAGGFIFIGRGSGLPYAAEGALKLKELTYRWAEHCPAGELKHGPLALIGNGTPVVVVDNADPKLATNVAEVEARGGRVITIGPAGSTVPVVDDPHAPWGPIAAAVPLQVLARTLALALGRDVDKPRNLAKSVTVE